MNNASINAVSYSWNIENGSPANSNLSNPQIILPDGEVGSYQVQLIATSDAGCKDTIVKEIQVLQEVLIYAPNSFTPHGDEVNQSWKVVLNGIDVYNFNLMIFDRWGEVIWESNDPKIGWDGTYKGTVVKQGTYTWVLKYKIPNNDQKREHKGTVNVIR